MGGAYDYELLDALKRIADSAERAAVALEKLSPPDKKERYEVKIPVPEKSLADTIRDILLEQVAANDSHQKLPNGKADLQTVGQRIKAARKAAGLTQQKLGEKLGVKFQTVAQWERGLRNPKLTTLQKVADACGCSVTYLAFGIEESGEH
jgi:DNA-binding XRE family transcriptional regulator